MVVQKSTKQTQYLTNLTRKKVEITTSIQYNSSINSSINGGQTDQFFRYTFCECLKITFKKFLYPRQEEPCDRLCQMLQTT